MEDDDEEVELIQWARTNHPRLKRITEKECRCAPTILTTLRYNTTVTEINICYPLLPYLTNMDVVSQLVVVLKHNITLKRLTLQGMRLNDHQGAFLLKEGVLRNQHMRHLSLIDNAFYDLTTLACQELLSVNTTLISIHLSRNYGLGPWSAIEPGLAQNTTLRVLDLSESGRGPKMSFIQCAKASGLYAFYYTTNRLEDSRFEQYACEHLYVRHGWTPKQHGSAFSTSFHSHLMCILMSAYRQGRPYHLPPELWRLIFSFLNPGSFGGALVD